MHTTLFPDLGTPAALRSAAASAPLLVNSHIHLPPNFSAFETVESAVALADAQDIRVLGVSNYYDYTVYTELATRAAPHGIYPIFGLEVIALDDDLQAAGIKVNDPGNPGRFYLCGKGITRFAPLSESAEALLATIRTSDSARMAELTQRLAACFSAAGLETDVTVDSIVAGVVARHSCAPETVYLQERHLAQAFQEALFAQCSPSERGPFLEKLCGVAIAATDAGGVQNALRSHLLKAGKPAFATETFVNFDHAYRLILALGGVPTYPTLADGTSPLCTFEASPEALIDALHARKIYAAELIPIRNSPQVLTRYVEAFRAAGIIVTAGTEHNTRDLIPLAPTCVGGAAIPSALTPIFWEGACVLAAHQYLTARGDLGYVDSDGNRTTESIESLAALGAAVIERYRGQ